VVWKQTLSLVLAGIMAAPVCCCLTSLHGASSVSNPPIELNSCCHSASKTTTKTEKKSCHYAQKQLKKDEGRSIKVARNTGHPVWPGTSRTPLYHRFDPMPRPYFQRLESPPLPSSTPARLTLLSILRC
jgi:hypothetical protein